MEKSRIALVGFRATGKSLIGRMLAEVLGWTFVDMDELLVASFGESIQDWVASHGWDAFRSEEARLLASLAGSKGQVVATGGGVVLRAENRELLRTRFFVVWLRAGKGTIRSRLSQDPKTASQRPPLTQLSPDAEIEALLAERKPLYEEVANVVVDTDDLSAQAVVSRLKDACGVDANAE